MKTRLEALQEKFGRPAFLESEADRKMREQLLADLARQEELRLAQELDYQLSLKKWEKLTETWSDEDRDWAWNFIQGHGVAIG